MKNPFEVLDVKEIEKEEQIKALTEQLLYLKKTFECFPKKFESVRERHFFDKKGYRLEEFLSERFSLGLSVDKKFFDEKDLRSFEGMDEGKSQIWNSSGIKQFFDLKREIENHELALNNYMQDPNNSDFSSKIDDLYLKLMFEKKVIARAKEMASTLSDGSKTFYAMMQEDSEYMEIREAYDKVATPEARADLVPELYVKARNVDSSGIFTVSSEEVDRLVKREMTFRKEWEASQRKSEKQRYEEGIPENQYHDYSWGIILRKPITIMKNEPVDTPIFKGTISVEQIGNFTEESMFNKRKYTREKREETTIDRIKKFTKLEKYTNNSQEDTRKTIRENYWAYKASLSLYDQIYKVTKTDQDGVTNTSIVISPLTTNDIGKEVDVDFIKNVYFSDYMLDLAKQNGGFSGWILPSPSGPSISYKYSLGELETAILFSKGIKGNIFDCRGDKKKAHYGKTNEDFLRILNQTERERSHDE